MKNFKFIVSFLLLNLTIFSGCQKQDIVSPNQSFINVDAGIVIDVQACDPTFPTITSSSSLFKYRYGIALYRYYAKIYLDYKIRATAALNSNPNAVVTVTLSDLVRLGLKEISPALTTSPDNLSSLAYEHFKGTQRSPWEIVKALLEACKSFPIFTQQAIVSKANGWGDSVPINASVNVEGSYTIVFDNPVGWTYSGKGGGAQGVTGRCIVSANSRCGNLPTIADAQKAAILSNFTLDRQAYKEEAVRMYIGGFLTKDSPGNTLNNIQSPGVGYIEADKI
jgi:hypothetical protein